MRYTVDSSPTGVSVGSTEREQAGASTLQVQAAGRISFGNVAANSDTTSTGNLYNIRGITETDTQCTKTGPLVTVNSVVVVLRIMVLAMELTDAPFKVSTPAAVVDELFKVRAVAFVLSNAPRA